MISENTLTECDKEEIQFLGQIQAHGIFLIVSKDNLIQVMSENSFQHIGVHAKALVNTHVDGLIPSFEKIKENLKQLQSIQLKDFEGESVLYQGVVHQCGENYLIDLVSPLEKKMSLPEVSVVESHEDIKRCLDEIAKFSGLDRVLLYLFETNGDGVVVGESKGIAGASLLNHWFPASDIPQQARQLYVKNKIRFISNINKQPVNLISSKQRQRVDLSDSWIRAVSPIHIEYLKNMGTSCSLSTSLVRNNKLIGLIACHSFAPITIDFIQMELILKISHSIEKYLNDEFEKNFNHRKQILRAWKNKDQNSLEVLKELFNVDEVEILNEAIISNGKHNVFSPERKYFYTDSFKLEIPPLVREGHPGVACVRLSKGKVLVLYRKEFTHDKIWGGAPRSKIPYKGGRIEPRKSFESFVEKVKNTSRSWSENEIRLMDYLSQL